MKTCQKNSEISLKGVPDPNLENVNFKVIMGFTVHWIKRKSMKPQRWKKREKEQWKLLLTVQCQLVNAAGMMEIGNHHLATIMEGTGFPGGAVVKKPTANAGDAGSAPGLGRPPEGRHGNPLHCSCLQNPMDRGAWWVTVHEVTKRQTQLRRLSTYTRMVVI